MAITLPHGTKELPPETKATSENSVGIVLLICLAVGLIIFTYRNERSPSSQPNPTVEKSADICLNDPPESCVGYINVKPGNSISLKVKNSGADPRQFTFNDFFQIVSILGDPRDPLKKLTDFETGDIWLLVKACNQKAIPSYFILRAMIKPEEIDDRVLGLKAKFENGEFLDQEKAKISSTGLFLFLSVIEIEEIYRESIENGPLSIESDLADFSVNSGRYHCIRADIFASKESGELTVTVNEKRKFRGSYGIGHGAFSFKLHFLKETEITCLPKMAQILPDAMEATLNQYRINWEKASSSPQTASTPINSVKQKGKKSEH